MNNKLSKQTIKCYKNPIISGHGICDPHLQLFENKVYLYTSHDKDAKQSTYAMSDWTVWSTEDFVSWKLENVICPEDFYMGSSECCWAVDAACANGKYYFYYSNGNDQIGVAVSDNPGGPFIDSVNSPVLDGTVTSTREYDPLIVEFGVGQYDSDWNKIEAEWYMKMDGSAIKTENPRYGFDVEIHGNSEDEKLAAGTLFYPNIRNVKNKKGIAFFASCNCAKGAVIEVWKQGDAENLIGICNVKYTKEHSWRSYRMSTCLLDDLNDDLMNIKLVVKVNGAGSCRLDYFKFYK